MKRFLYSLAIAMCITGLTASAQQGWYALSTGIDLTINDLEFYDENTGFAVADGGTIIRTFNGGSKWELVDAGTELDLKGVAFVDASTVMIVGQDGLVLRSTDLGSTWSTISIDNVSYQLDDIDFHILTGKGVIGGHTESIITSDDGGQNWTVQDDGWTEWYRRVQMVDNMHALTFGRNMTGQSLIGFTNDWDYWDFSWFTVMTSPGIGESGNSRDGFFFGEDDGYIIGFIIRPGMGTYGFLAPYYDWYEDFWPATEFPYALEGIDFQGDHGIMAGGNYDGIGYITESFDRGITWTDVPVPTEDVTFTKVQLVGTTGYIGGEQGQILKLDNATGIAKRAARTTTLFNYPNPVREYTSIIYDLPKTGHVSLELHDATGKKVRDLFHGQQEAGRQQVEVNTEGLVPGIYIYRLKTVNTTATGKMSLVK